MTGREMNKHVIARVTFPAQIGKAPHFEWTLSAVRVVVMDTADDELVSRMMAVRA